MISLKFSIATIGVLFPELILSEKMEMLAHLFTIIIGLSNDQTKTIKQKLQQGEAINIMYAQPWFWKCSMSKIPKS